VNPYIKYFEDKNITMGASNGVNMLAFLQNLHFIRHQGDMFLGSWFSNV
jgi:hypothetical protein